MHLCQIIFNINILFNNYWPYEFEIIRLINLKIKLKNVEWKLKNNICE